MRNTSTEILDSQFSIRLWLTLIALFIVLIVIVGGITRLTDSGLSITQWQPLSGIFPPLSFIEWQEAFLLYQQTTEYKIINSTMTLSQFQYIYFWEWLHRFLARLVGILFFFPFIWFWYRGALSLRLSKHLIAIFTLGALQGIVGWWMVQSGLTERVDVSHIRLSVHLFLACLIFVYLVYVIATMVPKTTSALPHSRYTFILLLCLFIQIILGSLLSGLDGGLSYNTWPKMGDDWIAPTIFQHPVILQNLYDNPAMIQFLHRTFPFIILSLFIYHTFVLRSIDIIHYRRSLLIVFLILFQILLGILTLLTQVTFTFALLHQLLGLCLLGIVTFHFQRLL